MLCCVAIYLALGALYMFTYVLRSRCATARDSRVPRCCLSIHLLAMTVRLYFAGNKEIGAFSKLTNAYCLVGLGGSPNFYDVIEGELAETIPVVHTNIAGCKIVGRLTAGNSHGLLVPSTTTDQELEDLKNSLPDSVAVERVEDKLSALGNVIACNDYAALVHPDLHKATVEILEDTLQVEVFRQTVAGSGLVGTRCCFNSSGGLVHRKTKVQDRDELSSLLEVPVVAGTVNRGSDLLGAGLVVNDWAAFSGMDTTSSELSVIDSIFKLDEMQGMPCNLN